MSSMGWLHSAMPLWSLSPETGQAPLICAAWARNHKNILSRCGKRWGKILPLYRYVRHPWWKLEYPCFYGCDLCVHTLWRNEFVEYGYEVNHVVSGAMLVSPISFLFNVYFNERYALYGGWCCILVSVIYINAVRSVKSFRLFTASMLRI